MTLLHTLSLMDSHHYYGTLLRQRAAGPFLVTESEFPSGAALPTHAHDAPYFTFTLRGSYSERYGAGSRLCTPGTAVAHPAFEAHSQEFAGEPALLIRVALAKPESAAQAAFQQPLCLTSDPIARAVLQLHRELGGDDPCSEMIVEGLAYELTARALESTCASGGSRRRALCAQTFIRSSLRYPISLATISRELGVSRATLYRDFKSAFGCAPGDYLRQARLDAAVALLCKSSRPISQIAVECGFFDQSHFDRCFRLAMGVSPSRYRAAAR